MQVKELNHVNEALVKEAMELMAICNKHDNLSGFLSLNSTLKFYKEMNTTFMLYEENRLVSILSLFVPSNVEAEVTACTHPEFRKRGYFKELVKRAETEMKKYAIPDILFVCDKNSVHGKAAIDQQNAGYDFTEYSLKYDHSMDDIITGFDYKLELRQATMEDIEKIIEISMTSFHDSYESAKSYATDILNSATRHLYIGSMDGEHVGMGSASYHEESSSINGLGVLPNQQGKGYGRELLYGIMKELLKKNIQNIILDVNSTNENAFQLYRKSGFEIESAYDYYRRPVS